MQYSMISMLSKPMGQNCILYVYMFLWSYGLLGLSDANYCLVVIMALADTKGGSTWTTSGT